MKKLSALSRFLGVFALLCIGVLSLYGQTTPKISMQGTLTDAAGRSVPDGKYNVTFRLYTTLEGGTAFWQETVQVTVDDAIYSHYLGSVVPLQAIFFVNKLFLGIQLLDGDEISPRTALTYAPYAFSVNTAKTVVCSGALGDVKHSILNPVQFAAENGDCWVPMDGAALPADCALRQLTGMTSLPDAGGLFIRGQEFSGGQDNDPGRTPDSTIARVQTDAFKSHSHTASTDGNHQHDIVERLVVSGVDWNRFTPANNSPAGGNDQQYNDIGYRVQPAGDHTHTVGVQGGSETRVKNLNFWIYIRIN